MNIRQRASTAPRRRARALRRRATYAEDSAWKTLRKLEGLPGRFRRQEPLGPYVVDFVCHAMKLVIEIDGGVHRLPAVAVRDARRDAWLRSRGFRVVHVSNTVATDPDALAARVFGAPPHP